MYPLYRHKTKKGFTLIELSIVIVIIGLIVAGIVAGQSLVKQATLRSVIAESQEYRTAVSSFYMAYNALPGDMINASSYWTDCASPATLCDGDGNGRIILGTPPESHAAWQTLAKAKLIPGNFVVAVQSETIFGVNAPESKLSSAAWSLRSDTWYEQNIDSAIGHANALLLGAFRATDIANASVLTPAETSGIDSKTDDNVPFTGRVKGIGGWNGISHSTDCTSGSGASSAYQVGTTSKECFMLFELDTKG